MRFIIVCILISIIAVIPFSEISAQSSQVPCRFHGTVSVNDGWPVPNGTSITAIIAGDIYTTETPSVYGPYTYMIDIIPPEDTTYSEGETIDFYIGSYAAQQTGTWETGGNKILDITALSPELGFELPTGTRYGENYEVWFWVYNYGDLPANPSIVRIYIDDVIRRNVAVSALDPDERFEVRIGGFSCSGESDLVEIYIDADNAVDETNEDNNYISFIAGEGCFIATAVSGNPDNDSNVQTLRKFRDENLLNNSIGSEIVSTYYELSPPVADFINDHPALKPVVRIGLLPAVGVSETVDIWIKIILAGTLLTAGTSTILWLRRKASLQ